MSALNETASVWAPEMLTDCRMLLSEGSEYITYGDLYSCGRLAVIQGSHPDLAVLGLGNEPQAGTSEPEP